jgi:hypothetical protein
MDTVRRHGEEEGSEDDEVESRDPGEHAQVDEAETDQAEDEVDPAQEPASRLSGRDRSIDVLGHPGNVDALVSDGESAKDQAGARRHVGTL